MKTLIKIMLCGCMAFILLAGCKANTAGQNFADFVGDYNPALHENKNDEPVEVSTLTSTDFTTDLGFKLVSWPQEADLSPYKYFAINKRFGQVEYITPDKRTMVLRVAHANTAPLTDTYSETHLLKKETRQIDGVEVSVGFSSKGCSMVKWKRGDFQYTLHSNASHGLPKDEEITKLVTGLDAADAGQ